MILALNDLPQAKRQRHARLTFGKRSKGHVLSDNNRMHESPVWVYLAA